MFGYRYGLLIGLARQHPVEILSDERDPSPDIPNQSIYIPWLLPEPYLPFDLMTSIASYSQSEGYEERLSRGKPKIEVSLSTLSGLTTFLFYKSSYGPNFKG